MAEKVLLPADWRERRAVASLVHGQVAQTWIFAAGGRALDWSWWAFLILAGVYLVRSLWEFMTNPDDLSENDAAPGSSES